MCLGIPMQVVELAAARALCRWADEVRWVDTRLIAAPALGDWLLVFVDVAREVLSLERATQIQDALNALRAVEQGDFAALAACFADLQQEPQLPAHLRPATRTGEPS